MERSPLRASASWSLCLAVALAIQLGFPSEGRAIIIEITSFEVGEVIPGLTTSGHAGRVTDLDGVTPTEGADMARISNQEANGAVATATIESDLGIGSGTINSIFVSSVLSTGSVPTSGSAFQITFAAEAGDELLFDFDFITSEATPEGTWTDFAWANIVDTDSSTTVFQDDLANANESLFTLTPNGNFDETDWQTFSMLLPSTATYEVTLGVMDVQDAAFDSFLVADYFRLSRTPEPGTASLLGIGLLGLAWQGRRRPGPRPARRPL